MPFARSRWFHLRFARSIGPAGVPEGPCIVRWQDGIAPYSISVPSSMERAKRLELSGTTWTALRAPETRAVLMERPQALERPQRY